MMRATAAEQNVPYAVTATESGLLDTLTFEQPHISDTREGNVKAGKALLIETPEGEIAGMAIYFITYAAWAAKPGVCLEDLYVLPEFRCRGFARLLLQEIAKRARDSGYVRMEWLCYKQNQRAVEFYRSIRAKEMDALTFFRLDGDDLACLAHESRTDYNNPLWAGLVIVLGTVC